MSLHIPGRPTLSRSNPMGTLNIVGTRDGSTQTGDEKNENDENNNIIDNVNDNDNVEGGIINNSNNSDNNDLVNAANNHLPQELPWEPRPGLPDQTILLSDHVPVRTVSRFTKKQQPPAPPESLARGGSVGTSSAYNNDWVDSK
jgi:hypothetical protein